MSNLVVIAWLWVIKTLLDGFADMWGGVRQSITILIIVLVVSAAVPFGKEVTISSGCHLDRVSLSIIRWAGLGGGELALSSLLRVPTLLPVQQRNQWEISHSRWGISHGGGKIRLIWKL